jgi:quercetin dioxygenase-like cupin family protein
MSPLKGTHMRHRLLQSALLALVVLIAGAGFVGRSLAAQTATPGPIASPGPIAVNQLAPGVTAEIFAAAPSDRAPGQTVYLARFVFQPGAAIFPHSHPGTTVLGVASGDFGWTLVKGTAHVVRAAASGAPSPTQDLTKPGDDVVLHPGDAIYYEDDVVHTARGAGDTPAVVFGTLVLTTGQPLLMPAGMNMSASPTP